MEFFKIFFLNFTLILLGFIIRGIAEKISIIIHMYMNNKKIWNVEKEYKEIKENEKEELLNIIEQYK